MVAVMVVRRARRAAERPERATPHPRAELLSRAAERFVAEADVRTGELVVDIGAGSGGEVPAM